ncbi:hypothetical protein G9F71_022525 [Clostridium sp. FP2]|uniref:hypothetical protein n=1 Tax=Clostridium sp. FP2 TaxID=2724481 RepID=UPI0013E98B4A|nr:hypothetical protein [Clostridium sp. FP2]MBZ9625608.1 hypothetical protein [Clostridium sp. FP2]
MKKFLNYMLKPMAIVSCIPVIGVLSYWSNHIKDLLATSVILYLGVIIGSAIKYFSKDKSNTSQ